MVPKNPGGADPTNPKADHHVDTDLPALEEQEVTPGLNADALVDLASLNFNINDETPDPVVDDSATNNTKVDIQVSPAIVEPEAYSDQEIVDASHDAATRYLWLVESKKEGGEEKVLADLERLLRYEEHKIDTGKDSKGYASLRALGMFLLDNPGEYEKLLKASKYADDAYANPRTGSLEMQMYIESLSILSNRKRRRYDSDIDFPEPPESGETFHPIIELDVKRYYDKETRRLGEMIDIPPDCELPFRKTIEVLNKNLVVDSFSPMRILLSYRSSDGWNLDRGNLNSAAENSLVMLQIMDQLGYLDQKEYADLAGIFKWNTTRFLRLDKIRKNYEFGVLKRDEDFWSEETEVVPEYTGFANDQVPEYSAEMGSLAQEIRRRRRQLRKPTLSNSLGIELAIPDTESRVDAVLGRHTKSTRRYENDQKVLENKKTEFEKVIDTEILDKLRGIDNPPFERGDVDALDGFLTIMSKYYVDHPGLSPKAKAFIEHLGSENQTYSFKREFLIDPTPRMKKIISVLIKGASYLGDNRNPGSTDRRGGHEYLLRLAVNEALVSSGVLDPTSEFVLMNKNLNYEEYSTFRAMTYDAEGEFKTYKLSLLDQMTIDSASRESSRPAKNPNYMTIKEALLSDDLVYVGGTLNMVLAEAAGKSFDKFKDVTEAIAEITKKNKRKAAAIIACGLLLTGVVPQAPRAIDQIIHHYNLDPQARQFEETANGEESDEEKSNEVLEAIKRFRKLFEKSEIRSNLNLEQSLESDSKYLELGPSRIHGLVEASSSPGKGEHIGFAYEDINFDWQISPTGGAVNMKKWDEAELIKIHNPENESGGDTKRYGVVEIGSSDVEIAFPPPMEENTRDWMVVTSILFPGDVFVPPVGFEVGEYVLNTAPAKLQQVVFGGAENVGNEPLELFAVMTSSEEEGNVRLNVLENHESEEYALNPDFYQAKRLLGTMDESSPLYSYYSSFIKSLEKAMEAGASNVVLSNLILEELDRYNKEFVSTTAYSLGFENKGDLIEQIANENSPYYCAVAVELQRQLLSPLSIRSGEIVGRSLYHTNDLLHTSRLGHVNTLVGLPDGRLVEVNTTPSIVEGITPPEHVALITEASKMAEEDDGTFSSYRHFNNDLNFNKTSEVRQYNFMEKDVNDALNTLGLLGVTSLSLSLAGASLRHMKRPKSIYDIETFEIADTVTNIQEQNTDLQAESIAELLRYLKEIETQSPEGVKKLAGYLTMEVFKTPDSDIMPIIETIDGLISDTGSQERLSKYLNSPSDEQDAQYQTLPESLQRLIDLGEKGRQKILQAEMSSRLRAMSKGKKPKEEEGMAAMNQILRAIGW